MSRCLSSADRVLGRFTFFGKRSRMCNYLLANDMYVCNRFDVCLPIAVGRRKRVCSTYVAYFVERGLKDMKHHR